MFNLWIKASSIQDVERNNNSRSARSVNDQWQAPPEGWIALNVDAAVFSNSGASSMVRRDAAGRFLGATVTNILGIKDPSI